MEPQLPDLPDLPGNFDISLMPPNQNHRVGHWSETDWRYYIYQCYRMVETVDAQIGLIYDTWKTTVSLKTPSSSLQPTTAKALGIIKEY